LYVELEQLHDIYDFIGILVTLNIKRKEKEKEKKDRHFGRREG